MKNANPRVGSFIFSLQKRKILTILLINQWSIKGENMSPRKSVEKELTRDLIIDTARRLFAQSGYQHVSMRKIAQELNYSHGALYYHFQNKAELFYAIISKDFSLLNELLTEIMYEDLGNKQKIIKILLRYIQFGLDHPNQYELMFLTKRSEVQWQIQQAPNESYEQICSSFICTMWF